MDDHPFVDLYGKPGDHQDELKVYGREGEPCRRCRAPVAKARFSNKPVYFCEACQVCTASLTVRFSAARAY